MIKKSKATKKEVFMLEQIFEDNNKNYLEDKFVLKDKHFDVFYVEENNDILGYISIYKKNDFITREHLPIEIDFKRKDLYIWNMCVSSTAENKGVGTSLLKHVTNLKAKHVYSIVNVKNLPSKHIHEKAGFEIVTTFEKVHIGQNEKFVLYKYTLKK